MRHDPGLAASPPVRYILEVERSEYSSFHLPMYTAQTPDGPKRKYVYGKRYGDVQRKLAEAMGDAARGIVVDDKNLTVGDYLDLWLSDVVRGTVREST